MKQAEEAWNDVGEQFTKLGSMFRHYYEAHQGEETGEVDSESDVDEAVRILEDSMEAAFGAFGDAVTDPDLQDEARRTAGSFLEALAATFSALGAEISGEREDST